MESLVLYAGLRNANSKRKIVVNITKMLHVSCSHKRIFIIYGCISWVWSFYTVLPFEQKQTLLEHTRLDSEKQPAVSLVPVSQVRHLEQVFESVL